MNTRSTDVHVRERVVISIRRLYEQGLLFVVFLARV